MIDLKKVLLAGTAIVAMGAFSQSAWAEDCSGIVPGADCTIDEDLNVPLTLGAGDFLIFDSSTQLNVNGTIDADSAAGQGSVFTAGGGTEVVQNADIGAGTAIGGFTVGSGDVWFVSSSSIDLISTGTLTLDGGEMVFIGNGSAFNGANVTVTGSATADTIEFTSAGNHTFTVGAVSLGDGADEILFDAAGAGSIFTASSLSMGAGNDSIEFSNGGSIDLTSSGTLDLGTDDDTISFISGGAITAGTISGGTGTDAMNFGSANFTVTSQVTGVETIDMATGHTLTFGNASGVSSAAITLSADNAALVFNSAGGTISGTITGAAGAQAVTLTDGTISSTISLGADIDTVTLTAGTLSGTVDMGAGADILTTTAGTLSGAVDMGADNDTINLNGGTTFSSTISGGTGTDALTVTAGTVVTGGAWSAIEDIDVNGNTLTIGHAITGVDSATQDGLNVNGGNVNINSGGSVAGTIFGAGNLVFGADDAGGSFTAGGIIEDVALFVSSGSLSTGGFAFGSAAALASVTVQSGASLSASDNITTTGALLMDGTLSIGAGDTVSAATYTDNNTGTFSFAVSSTAGTLTSGALNLTAGALDLSGGETVTFSVGSGSGVLQDGDSVVFASATGGATAPASSSDTSFLYDFTIADTGTALEVTVSQANSIASSSDTANNQTVATILLTDPELVNTTDANLLALQGAVQGASTREEFNEVLEQAQPTVDGSSVAAALTVTNNSLNLTGDRLAALRNGDDVTGMTTGNLTQGVRSWTQAFGAMGEQGRRDNIDGYEFETVGVAFGMDTENIGDDNVFGMAVSYANTDADSENASLTNTQTDSYQVTLYGEHQINNRTYVNGMAAYTLNEVSTSRRVLTATASGDFDANQFTARAETGRDYAYGMTTITPRLTGHWTHYDPDGYTETGAGGAGLVVAQDAVDIAELGIGVDANWLFRNSDGSYFSPEVSIGYRYDVIGDDVQMTSRFVGGGQAFATQGFDPQQSTVDVGAGFTYYSTDNWELTAEYDYEWKEDFDAHSGVARAAYRW